MKIMIINLIAIISVETKEAKIQRFQKGINVVTSSGVVDGNFTGKSSVLRSIFHTLGADGKFNYNKWESEGKYIYILDFSVENENYIMLRRGSFFKMYHKDNLYNKIELLFAVNNRDKLAEELVKLFNQEIYLKSHEGTYKLAHPAYNYLLNYIEQKEIKLTEFRTFNQLNAFPASYYSDLIYSHLGVRNDKENELKENLNNSEKRKKELSERKNVLFEMNKEITSEGHSNLNIEDLKSKIRIHEERYRVVINKLNKHKSALMEAHNTRVELELLWNDIDGVISSEQSKLTKSLKTHTCPYCQTEINDEESYYFHKVKHIDSYSLQKLMIEEQLANINRKIELENNHYTAVQKEADAIENEIFNISKEVKDGILVLGIKEIESNIIKQMTLVENEIISIDDLIKDINEQLRKFKKQRDEVDSYYSNYLNQMLLYYRINGLDLKENLKAADKLETDGSETNIAAVAWLLALLKTKYKYNSQAVIYPIIFDTPNNADLDEANKYEIFRMIFDHLPQEGQIITSLVGFDENKFNEYDINVIVLNNPQYDLLNREDYQLCNNLFGNIIKF